MARFGRAEAQTQPPKEVASFADILKPRLAGMEVEVNAQLCKARGSYTRRNYFDSNVYP